MQNLTETKALMSYIYSRSIEIDKLSNTISDKQELNMLHARLNELSKIGEYFLNRAKNHVNK